ncbi:MAG: amidohydrolase family protein, partial [Microbacterium sp.]
MSERTVVLNAKVVADGGANVATVIVRGGRIVRVEAADADGLDIAPGDAVVDARGGWLIPGLIDLHVHLCYGHLGGPSATSHEAMASGRLNARTTLMSGVTTVRDVGAFQQLNLALAEEIRRGGTPGPRVIASGDFLSTVDGHCSYWARTVDGPESVRQAVREQLAAGAEAIKVMASAGVADSHEDPTVAQLDLAELTAAVEEAAKAGRRVAAHAHPEQAIRDAVRAGCATIEHGTYLTDEAVDEMIRRDVAVVPTLAVYERLAAGTDGDVKDTRAQAAAIWDEKIPRLRRAIARGVRVGVGTDSGS